MPESDMFTCNFCGKKFCHSDRLRVHRIRAHTKDFPFICDQCPYKTTDKSYLDVHLARHKFKKDQEENGDNILERRPESMDLIDLFFSFSSKWNHL